MNVVPAYRLATIRFRGEKVRLLAISMSVPVSRGARSRMTKMMRENGDSRHFSWEAAHFKVAAFVTIGEEGHVQLSLRREKVRLGLSGRPGSGKKVDFRSARARGYWQQTPRSTGIGQKGPRLFLRDAVVFRQELSLLAEVLMATGTEHGTLVTLCRGVKREGQAPIAQKDCCNGLRPERVDSADWATLSETALDLRASRQRDRVAVVANGAINAVVPLVGEIGQVAERRHSRPI